MATEKLIFPSEIIEFTTEHHFYRYNSRSNIIYQAVLCITVLAFISLFFIKVDVSVNGQGLLTAINERNMVKAPISGRIKQVYVKLNQEVQANDILFTIETNQLNEQSSFNTQRRIEISQRLSDLRKLTHLRENSTIGNLSLQSALYRQQYNLYIQQYSDAQLHLENAQGIYERNKKLYDKQVISDAEFEKVHFDYQAALNKKRLIHEQQINQWQTDLNSLNAELMDLTSQHERFEQEKDLYTVKAPINGSLQQFNGILPGNFVTVGETVVEISPDSGLIAIIGITPRDIGLLRPDMPVRLQIDAFNYHEWGMVSGSIVDISKDVDIDENRSAIFQVKCQLQQGSLYLPNGYEGRLKKGMSVQARFQIARRSLFQLLYDKVDNWLNPANSRST
ncbi:HlyD family efflux transporter periplasmic adaptor subunit [Olivibacter sp. SDN3]|uniref:HlyD family secretion protein n=1 Tax=Olivibacter sp. SDN3 TaxID=2764720 RepID=UPI001651275F|nr:HlyD family efflux transporter periplasmic adaptor subunit [Olivibacter sp. SDN3]QNL52062.1 HlyD family efflux transporter periplasmic adaptor subunit [Olivibacter sp. SDN3]